MSQKQCPWPSCPSTSNKRGHPGHDETRALRSHSCKRAAVPAGLWLMDIGIQTACHYVYMHAVWIVSIWLLSGRAETMFENQTREGFSEIIRVNNWMPTVPISKGAWGGGSLLCPMHLSSSCCMFYSLI